MTAFISLITAFDIISDDDLREIEENTLNPQEGEEGRKEERKEGRGMCEIYFNLCGERALFSEYLMVYSNAVWCRRRTSVLGCWVYNYSFISLRDLRLILFQIPCSIKTVTLHSHTSIDKIFENLELSVPKVIALHVV